MGDSPIRSVSDTAFMTAAYRARENERPDALFSDPLAAVVAGEHGRAIIDGLPPRAFMGGWTVIVRTFIIDELLQGAVAEGVDTVLNLGAGLDTRPYRMDLPPTLRWVEADCREIVDHKDERLAGETAHCHLRRVVLDLEDGDARRAFLDEALAPSTRALVLTEGVTPYLPEEVVARFASDLRSHDAIAHWIADYFSPAAYEYRRKSGMTRTLESAPFRFEPQDYFGFFAEAGWTPQQTRYFAEEAERLGRPAPFPWPIRLLSWVGGFFAPEERRREMKRFAGFVMFGPG